MQTTVRRHGLHPVVNRGVARCTRVAGLSARLRRTDVSFDCSLKQDQPETLDRLKTHELVFFGLFSNTSPTPPTPEWTA